MGRKIGILAGGGQLPAMIADSVIAEGGSVHIVGVLGEADENIARFPHTWANWGQIGLMLETLREKGGGEMVIAGTVKRPDLFKIRPDLGFFRVLPELLRMLKGGDDSVLTRVVKLLERYGLTVRGAHEVAPSLLAGAGQLGGVALDAQARADAALGYAVRQVLGPLDAGQAVVVADGTVVAIEGAEGTDRMLARVKALANLAQGRRGVLTKGPKPKQELRVDMPVVGAQTIDNVVAAGLAGVVLEAGGVLLLDRVQAIAKADAAGCALSALQPDALRDAAQPWLSGPSRALPGVVRCLGTTEPSDAHRLDILRGIEAVTALAPLGTGRSVVVTRSFILAIEAAEGTIAVLDRVGQLRQWGLGKRRAGVLVMRAQAGDAHPVDDVLNAAARQGLAGVAIVGPAEAAAPWRAAAPLADTLGIFVAAVGDGMAATKIDGGSGRGGMDVVADLRSASRAEAAGRRLKIFLVAGEHSGDALGAKLMSALKAQAGDRALRFDGVGGAQMEAQGLASIFPMHEVAVMGIGAIIAHFPTIARRVYQTIDAAVAAKPDVVVIIDSPEFTHPIAKRIRKRAPGIPIVDYVSPSVWAWRPGRARAMKAYVDHVLGLLPFEPAAHVKLGGPPCSYVGHPLTERTAWIQGLDTAALEAKLGLTPEKPFLVVLPGSRSSEVRRLMQPFGEGLKQLIERVGDIDIAVPLVESVRGLVEEGLVHWPKRPHFITGEEDKFRAFKRASCALAASGTVTLELGLSGTPMIVAYKVDPVMIPILRLLITADSAVLVNLILGEKVIPELLQEDCTGANIASALMPLMADTGARRRQIDAMRQVGERMALPPEAGRPSEAAARIVLGYARAGRG